MKLKNKTAVITGGNGGIGFATAKLFKSEGAKLALFGRDPVQMNAAVQELGADVMGKTGDVSSVKDLESFFDEVKRTHGKIDTLFVNAGISKSAKIEDVTEAFFAELFDVNVKGAFYTIQKALPLMSEGGSIVVTASNSLHNGYQDLSTYSATKGALKSMVHALAAELLPRKIRINAVSPGPIATKLLTKDLDQKTHDMVMATIAEQIPMKRMGEACEIAKAVLFLSSDDSSFMTGEEIIVDGGMTAIG